MPLTVRGPSSSSIPNTRDGETSRSASSSARGDKRPAPDLPQGMPSSYKQKKADSGTSAGSWEKQTTNFGISGGGIPKTSGGKGKALEEYGKTALADPSTSPVGAIGSARPGNLIKKVAAPNAGDHSPSISAVNRTQSNQARVLGRGAAHTPGAFNVDETDVPTLQFTNRAFREADGSHATSKDSAAHSVFTSLREMHGVGERSAHQDMDSLLDSTARAYSPYNAHGEPNPGGVNLPRTNIHAESKKGASLHRSEEGVKPLVGQQMMNMWYRRNMSRQRDAASGAQNGPDDPMDTDS